jgi:hypothetical protein
MTSRSNELSTLTLSLGRKLAELEIRMLITLIFMSFKLDKTPTDLGGYAAHDVITHTPWKCYVKLTELE